MTVTSIRTRTPATQLLPLQSGKSVQPHQDAAPQQASQKRLDEVENLLKSNIWQPGLDAPARREILDAVRTKIPRDKAGVAADALVGLADALGLSQARALELAQNSPLVLSLSIVAPTFRPGASGHYFAGEIGPALLQSLIDGGAADIAGSLMRQCEPAYATSLALELLRHKHLREGIEAACPGALASLFERAAGHTQALAAIDPGAVFLATLDYQAARRACRQFMPSLLQHLPRVPAPQDPAEIVEGLIADARNIGDPRMALQSIAALRESAARGDSKLTGLQTCELLELLNDGCAKTDKAGPHPSGLARSDYLAEVKEWAKFVVHGQPDSLEVVVLDAHRFAPPDFMDALRAGIAEAADDSKRQPPPVA